MASEYDGQIVTLLVQEGNTPGQPIATFIPSGRNRYLVFMPKEAPVGKQVRVKLVDTGSLDRRQMALFRAEPAPVEYTERWKDNSDGTASRVKIATDWLLQESQDSVLETRPLAKRDGAVSIQYDLQVVWGSDLASSVVEGRQVKLTPLEEERVEVGQIVWSKAGERQEVLPVSSFPISKIGDINSQVTTEALQKLQWGNWGTFWPRLEVFFLQGGQENSISCRAKWEDFPVFVQTQLQKDWPICSCGQSRRTITEDGYGKCELCRVKEACVRCGKQTTVKNLNGRLVCTDCEPYEEAEKLINDKLPQSRREQIAAEARKLLAGTALPHELGRKVLSTTGGEAGWARYEWYYFTPDGVYGTKFSPAALQLLEQLSNARGNGLIELVAWLTGGPTGFVGDYFFSTQVKGEQAPLPVGSLADELPRIAADEKPVIADWLRGSEEDRREVVRLTEELEKDFPQILLGDLLKIAKKVGGYNYRKTLEALRSVEIAVRAAREYLSCCPLCGRLFDSRGICDGSNHPDLPEIRDENGNLWIKEGTLPLFKLETTSGAAVMLADIRLTGERACLKMPYFKKATVWLNSSPWLRWDGSPFKAVKLVPVATIVETKETTETAMAAALRRAGLIK